ncbi:FAD-binding oxidoreductase [Metabacillus sp. GX 13764]|uniref:NAD(P)/FAD-dependent oxidoreductase n=1 Tax=Metabacillus kandeliae TaxID=2900151 RepID=UPI001E58A362|nr:FAD-binding oxidoreductase [Metabacillus kandeliae]MCD7033613.1 FAD-binding oxidoreductase [Metabacillus kandeliae]
MTKHIIIGAGILGASAAYHLAKKGHEVLIIDRNDPGQATAAAAGIICPWISQRRNKAWYQLAKSGAAFYPGLIKNLEADGETDTGYERAGAISLHPVPEKIQAMEERTRKRLADAPEIGVLSRLSPEEAKRMFPPIAGDLEALHISGAARVDGRLLRDALLRAACKNGAVLRRGSAVLEYEGKTVTGILADEEIIPAASVSICAGAWAGELVQPLGLNINITHQRAQIVHMQAKEKDTKAWPVVMPPSDQYLLAFEKGRIVAGSTHEDTERFDSSSTAGGIAEVLQKAFSIAPGLAEYDFLEARVGFRPYTEGFLPVIGPLPGFKGAFFVNGLGASGLTMGPYLGAELAKLAAGEETEIDLSLYEIKL